MFVGRFSARSGSTYGQRQLIPYRVPSPMKLLSLLLLVCTAASLPAQTPEKVRSFRTTTSPRVVKTFEEERIPHLVFQDLTFPEAFDLVRQAWRESHPTGPYPVHYMIELTSDARCSADLTDISYSEAFRHIASLGGIRIRQVGGALVLYLPSSGGLFTKRFRILPAVAKELGIVAQPGESPMIEPMKEILEKEGIVFSPVMAVCYLPESRKLIFRAHESGMEDLEALLKDLEKRARERLARDRSSYDTAVPPSGQ